MKMNFLHKSAAAMGMAACLLAAPAFRTIAADKEGEILIIRQKPQTPVGSPRMPAYNPFYAELEADYVLLGSVSSYGTVTVTLSSTAGDGYTVWFDTDDGTILLPISGAAGSYTLTITVSDSLQFIGEFEL